MSELDKLRDTIADAVYAGGDEAEWLTTSDGSPNAASYELADRVLAALPSSAQWRVLCVHGSPGVSNAEETARTTLSATHCDDTRLQMRRVIAGVIGPWITEESA